MTVIAVFIYSFNNDIDKIVIIDITIIIITLMILTMRIIVTITRVLINQKK